LLQSAAVFTQVIVATQSVSLVDQFEPEEIIVTERRNGATEFARLDPNSLQAWLEEYSVGELWEKNVIGGRP
jgi:predicted ATPase